jgi:hypothetical protein
MVSLCALLLGVGCLGGDASEESSTAKAATRSAGHRVAEEATKRTCEDSLQAKIDATGPGGTVRLAEDCVYREALTVSKPITLRGPGEIRGSDVWAGWNKNGSEWTSDQAVPGFSMLARFQCAEGTERCLWPEQVFVDGEPLKQVASDPDPGEFALDSGRHVVLAQDPAGHAVEVTVRPNWVTGAAPNVTIDGVAMRHAAMDGVWNGGYPNWTVENSDLSWAHAANLKLTLATGLVVRDDDLHHGGQMGLASNEAGIEVLGNRVYANNTEGFDTGWEAGGMKLSQPFTAQISDNVVYDNQDVGIWVDTVNANQSSVEIERNRVHHHPWQGIRVEITKNFDVRDNVVWENGWGEGDSYNGSGISIDGCFDGTVEDNVLAWNASGIGVVQQNRFRPEEKPYQTTKNVRLERNKIIQNEIPGSFNHAAIFWNGDDGAVAEGAVSIYDAAAGNGGVGNEFWFDEPEGSTYRFKWVDQIHTLSDYNASPAEQDGRYLTNDEKNHLLRSNGLPGAPSPRPSAEPGLFSSLVGWLQSITR